MAAWLGDPDIAPPHGESMAAAAAGCGRPATASSPPTPAVRCCVVSHVTPIKTLVRIALDAPVAAMYRMHLDLAALSEIAWYADGPAMLRSYNETFHLEGLEA